MEIMVTKTRYSREGCRITTVARTGPDNLVHEEIILQAEDLAVPSVKLELAEEDTGQWLIAGS